MFVARLEVLDADDRRLSDRRPVDLESTVRGFDAQPLDVVVRDFSRTGVGFTSTRDLPLGTEISIGLAGAGATRATIVRRVGDEHGCEFDTPLTPAQAAIAFAISSVVEFAPAGGVLPSPATAPREKWAVSTRVALLLAGAAGTWAVAVTAVLLALK